MTDTATAAPQRPLTPALRHSALSPAIAHSAAATVGELLTAFSRSAEPELLKVYHAYAPWFVQMALPDAVIDHGIQYAIAMVENAAQGAILSLPQAQEVIGYAVTFLDQRVPKIAQPFVGPLEEIVVAKLQKLGLLPAAFSRAALRKAA